MKPSYKGSKRFARKSKETTSGKDAGRPTSGSTKSTHSGMIPELPVLVPPSSPAYNVMTNGFQHFKDKLLIYFSAKYGLHGTFLATGAYHQEDPPEPPEYEYDPGDRAIDVLWQTYESECAEHMRELRRQSSDRVSWFNVILGQLSDASKDLIEAHDDWEEANNLQDPLQFWTIIEATHLTAQTGAREIDRDAAMDAYWSLTQGRNETLPNYRRRFERTVAALEALRHPGAPEQAAMVVKFVRSLNYRYTEWSRHILNEIIEGKNPPASVEEAVRRATKWVPANHSSGEESKEGPGTAFATTTSKKDTSRKTAHATEGTGTSNKSKGKGGKDRKGGRPQPTLNPKPNDVKDSTSSGGKAAGAFNICGQEGHFAKDCRFKDKVQKLIAEGKITYVTTATVLLEEAKTGEAGPILTMRQTSVSFGTRIC